MLLTLHKKQLNAVHSIRSFLHCGRIQTNCMVIDDDANDYADDNERAQEIHREWRRKLFTFPISYCFVQCHCCVVSFIFDVDNFLVPFSFFLFWSTRLCEWLLKSIWCLKRSMNWWCSCSSLVCYRADYILLTKWCTQLVERTIKPIFCWFSIGSQTIPKIWNKHKTGDFSTQQS